MDKQAYYIVLVNVVILSIIFIVMYAEISESGEQKNDNVFVNSRLVWPEDLPDGDRIREQMAYVPDDYDDEKTPVKRILIHTGLGSEWERPRLDQEEFVGCPVSRCSLTVNTSYGPEVDAVLFRHTYTRPEFERPPNQIWIMSHSEAPYATPALNDTDVFNWTATYRWDSDIPYPYEYFMKYDSPRPRAEVNFAANKTKKVAWFVSNCHPYSNRTAYANELAKHIQVDIYGDCGPLKCPRSIEHKCFEMLETDYKFYLAFENAHCRHYITEKLFKNALRHDVLPIVMGPTRKDYELMAPSGSFIHVDDFESPESLAEYLHKIDGNDELYNEYFRWKSTGKVVHDTKYYCRMCAMLHDTGHPAKHYEDFNKWWSGPGVCAG